MIVDIFLTVGVVGLFVMALFLCNVSDKKTGVIETDVWRLKDRIREQGIEIEELKSRISEQALQNRFRFEALEDVLEITYQHPETNDGYYVDRNESSS